MIGLIDKLSGKVFTDLNRFVDGGDAGDEYNYCLPLQDSFVTPKIKKVTIQQGEVLSTLVIDLEIRAPIELAEDRKARSKRKKLIQIRTSACLYPGIPRVDFHTEIDNQVKDHRLRVHFPYLNNSFPEFADHDGHFEVVRRKVGIPTGGTDWVEDPRPEVPQRMFADISDGQVGMMVANRGLPEVEVLKTGSGEEISITLLRCVGWLSRDDLSNRKGHAGPFLPTPGAQMQGNWAFDYSLIPHPGNWDEPSKNGYPFQHAANFNCPLKVVETNKHPGNLETSGSFLIVEPDLFVISAIKQSQDRTGWLVRGYNISNKELEVKIRLLVDIKKAELVNLAEKACKPLKPGLDRRYYFSVLPHEIITIKFYYE